MKVLIHHSEIGLKKGNFNYFEKKLMKNIKTASEKNKLNLISSTRNEKRIICEFENSEKEISEVLTKIPGIKNFSFAEEIEKDFNKLSKKVEAILKIWKKENIKEIAFETKRSDKTFPLTSVEINSKLGETAKSLGFKFNYKNPEKTIFIEVTYKKIYIYKEKILGVNGLPVGSSGRVLCLLSGGIDSPVSAFLMMKRGCIVDFLHFHTFKTNQQAFESKIKKLAEKITIYENKSKLYLVPYTNYEISSQGQIPEKYDLIFFKNYMLKTAELLCEEMKYDAIVTGDNLAQVASQTIENLNVSEKNINKLILRPLLTYDKQEIITLAKKIRTYEISIEDYKDCCSILSKKPSTKTKEKTFNKFSRDFDTEKLAEETMKDIEMFKIE
jgi:thiamine biosynthesis protein ThiI